MLHYGKVEDGKIEYVKGHDYEVASFLGDVEMTQRVRALHSQSAAPFFHVVVDLEEESTEIYLADVLTWELIPPALAASNVSPRLLRISKRSQGLFFEVNYSLPKTWELAKCLILDL